jgi:hypothetical protein
VFEAESKMEVRAAEYFCQGGVVEVKVYEESNEGIIQSWVERGV